jgi:hypothetical protein
MDRCPNCGATVRTGAKFCTTCGMRLPESAAATQTTETPTRSPFDSTSTVASRWPSRTIYGTSELTPPESMESSENGGSTGESLSGAGAETVADEVVAEAPGESPQASSWGAWSPPTASTEAVEEADISASTASNWGDTGAAVAEPEAADQVESADEQASTWGTRPGETDFLSLPEQPDPAAWASIESELQGSSSAATTDEPVAEAAEPEMPVIEEAPSLEEPQVDAGEAVESIEVTEPVEVEVEAAVYAAEDVESDIETEEPVTATESVEEATVGIAPVAPSPSVDRANELLDELREVITGLSAQPAYVEPEAVAVALPLFEGVKPSAEEIARFAELRAAVDAGSERPRDIDTMLDLSGRLDTIKELHDAYTRLSDAIDGAGSAPAESEGINAEE